MKCKYRFKYRNLIPHFHNWKEVQGTLRAIKRFTSTPNCDIEVKCSYCNKAKRILKDVTSCELYRGFARS